MRWWRNLRVFGIHALTWAVLLGGVSLAVVVQRDSFDSGTYGWPMEMLDRDTIGSYWFGLQPLPPQIRYEWHWAGAFFNVCLFAAIAIASAWVCERLVCCWHKPWQITIAAILW